MESPKYNAFGVMCLSIENEPFAMMRSPVMTPITPINGTSVLPIEKIAQLKTLDWRSENSPLIFFKYSKKEKTVYITGEVPEIILEKKDKKALKQWFDLVIQLLFNNTDFRTKNFDLDSLFKMDIEIAEKYSLALPKGGTYCLIGDALMPANFLLGHGISNALQDANMLFHMVENKFSESESYRDSRLREYKNVSKLFEDTISSNLELLETERQLGQGLKIGVVAQA